MNAKPTLIFLLLSLSYFQISYSQTFLMQNGTDNTCSGTFYDTGGSGGNYSNFENLTYTICPSTPGDKIEVAFTSFAVETFFDNLLIYDGNSTASPFLGTFTGFVNPGTFTSTHATGCLTFQFQSDFSITFSGWEATISCVSSCVDAAPPTITCPATQTEPADANCMGTLSDYTGLATVNDDCDASPTVTQSPLPGTTFSGSTMVTLTATDATGNSTSCMFTVEVEDNTPPTAVCKQLVEDQSFISPNVSSSGGYTLGSSIQQELGQSITVGTTGPLTKVVFYLVTAFTFNNNTLTLTIVDGTDPNVDPVLGTKSITQTSHTPTFNLDTPIPVTAGQQITLLLANVSLEPTQGVPQDSGYPGGTAYFRSTSTPNWTPFGADMSFTTFVGAAPEVCLDANGMGTLDPADVDDGSFDNCGPVSLSVSPNMFTCADIGSQSVTLIVTDQGGLSSSCMTTVEVKDKMAPTAVCTDVTVNIDVNEMASVMASQIAGASTDNCSTPTLQITGGHTLYDCDDLGMTFPVTVVISDASGNSTSCTRNVTVADPNGNCCAPADAVCMNTTVQLDANGMASITPADVDGGSTAECGLASMTVNPNSFTCANIGSNNMVTLTVTDVNGDSDQCTATVTVEDNIPPTITCPANFTVNNDPGVCQAFVTFPIPQWDDNCQRSLLEYRYRTVDANNVPTGAWSDWFSGFNTGTFAVGKWEFEWRAQDAVPNYNYCYYFMEVLDNEAPSLVCQSPTVYLEPDGTYTLHDTDVLDFVNSTDNCSALTVTGISPSTVDCDDFDTTLPVSVTVSDAVGNTATCVAMVNVQKGDALPAGWDHDDIGGATGDAGFDPCEEKFFVESNGISHPLSDKIHMAYRAEMCGNVEIIARVLSISAGGLAGVIIRETLDGGSKKVALRTQLQPFVHRDVRATTNGYQTTQQLFRPQATWLRLVRNGNMFLGYTSTNGINWTFAFFTTVSMNSCVNVGLFAEGPIDNVTSVACFDNVSVTGGVLPLVDGEGNTWTTDEVKVTSDFRVFPNPAADRATIDLSQFEDSPFTLRVLNNLGQVVYYKEYLYLEEYLETLDLSQYNNGIYMISIETKDGEQHIKKLVVNK